ALVCDDGDRRGLPGGRPRESDLRPRVGNPDEMKSNRMVETLAALHFRVTAPEEGVPESIGGAVITALNEEAVACAALGNKGGINIIVTYEAFGAKMHGALRQEIVFADEQNAAGRPSGWLSVPLVLTSHAWENAKNERSHQDPVMAEAMLGEPSDVSRVLFPPDRNTAAVLLQAVYQTRGQIWTLVVPKAEHDPESVHGGRGGGFDPRGRPPPGVGGLRGRRRANHPHGGRRLSTRGCAAGVAPTRRTWRPACGELPARARAVSQTPRPA